MVAKSQIFGEEAVALLLLHPPFQLASLRQGMGGQFIVAAVDGREGVFRTLAWVVGIVRAVARLPTAPPAVASTHNLPGCRASARRAGAPKSHSMFERSELEWDKKKKKRVSFFFSNPLRFAIKAILASRAGMHYSIVSLPYASNFCLVAKSQVFRRRSAGKRSLT